MDPKKIKKINFCLWVVTCAIAYQFETMQAVNAMFSTFGVSFNIFIYPGIFYFFANKKRKNVLSQQNLNYAVNSNSSENSLFRCFKPLSYGAKAKIGLIYGLFGVIILLFLMVL